MKILCTTGQHNADVGFPLPGWSNSPFWKMFISGVRRLMITYIPIAESGDQDFVILSVTDLRCLNGENKPRCSIRLFTNELVSVSFTGFASFATQSGCPYRLRISCDSRLLENNVTIGLLKAEARYITSNNFIPSGPPSATMVRSPSYLSLRRLNGSYEDELPCEYVFTSVKTESRRGERLQ